MTTVALLADAPEGDVLPELVAGTPLSAAEASTLYGAMLADVARAVARSGGDLLVNYADEDGAETAIRETLDRWLDGPDARYEVQVGSTFSARAGNTVTHLLDREDERSVAVVEPTAAFLGRQQIDSAAMKLRSSEVVLGPTTGGRVYYAGFTEPVDFDDAFAPPAVETLVRRAREAGLSVDFLPMLPVVETPTDLLTALPVLAARTRAERIRPGATASVLDDLGLAVAPGDGGEGDLTVRRA
ncbi:hypothetical protein BRC83_07765 [Halobacteriales archaeon QS_1_68_17]|nr:MAG: hypothetical protein BRC83_07765 [Halobacteriales archaeon QS_1_68_17]